MHAAAVIAIVAVSIALMLIRPRGIAEAWWVCGGAVLLVATGLIPFRLAGHAIKEGSDVYFFLIGMMLLAELAREEGVFSWLASVAVAKARGSRRRLFMLVYGIGVVVTAFLSNDATAVVLTPAILAAVRRAKVEPLPYLFACALVANAASFIFPISNPANLVVFRGNMPPLGHWILAFGLASVLSVVVTFVVLRVIHRPDLRGVLEESDEREPLARSGKWTLAGLALVSVVLLVSSAFGVDLGLPTCGAAAVITLVIRGARRKTPLPLLREISWSTLALVAGLFVMVDAVEDIGALGLASRVLARVQAMPANEGAAVAAGAVATGNNVVNNLPLGLLVGGTLDHAHVSPLLQRALLIGVDLGPNLSVTGSLATILWLLALRKEGVSVTFFQFLRVGVIAMPLALMAALVGAAAMARALHP